MSLYQPPFVLPGLVRLDAVAPDDDRLVVRVRSAAALGVPLCPWTVHAYWRPSEAVAIGAPGTAPDPAYVPIHAVTPNADEGEIWVRDAWGAVTHVTGPDPSAVAGAHLVEAWGSSETVGWVPDFSLSDHGETWAIAADPEVLPDGPWRTTGTDAVRDDQALADLLGSSGAFVHPFDHLDSLPPGTVPGSPGPVPVAVDTVVARGREVLDPALASVHDELGGAAPPAWHLRRLESPAERGNGAAGLDLATWLAVAGIDVGAASLLGTYAVLTGVGRRTMHTLTASAAFAVPVDVDPATTPTALRVASWLADLDPVEQEDLRHHLTDAHPGLAEVADRLPDSHRLVCLLAPAIVGRLPVPPRPPALALSPTGVRVGGHQGAPISLRRFDPLGEHRDRLLVVPASGEVLDPVGQVPPGAVLYEGQCLDAWGQWSGPAASDEGTRPVPPTAPPTVTLELDAATIESLPGDEPASPGTVVVRAFAALPPRFGAPIEAMTATVTGGQALSVPLVPDPSFSENAAARGRWWRGEVRVVDTRPGERVTVGVRLTARAGAASLPAEPRSIRVVDPRPVAVELFSRVLLFAGSAGPDPTDGAAEVDLVVPHPVVPPGTLFRLYAADEAALTGAVPADGSARHARVDALVDAARSSSAAAWVRLPDQALTSLPTGELRVRTTLPGRAESLRALRLAAVSVGGVEAPGSRSGAFVVAVPLDDVPGTPTLAVERSGARRLRASVVLTHPRPDGQGLPGPFRLRGVPADRSLQAEVWWSPAAAEPHLVGVLASTVELVAEPASDGLPWCWRGEVELVVPAALPPWTALRLATRVAWPDEPAWVPGTTPVRGQVRRRWGDLDAQPGRWGPWSAPAAATADQDSLGALVSATGGGPQLDQPRLVLPRLAPGSPPYRVQARCADADPVRFSTLGGDEQLPLRDLTGVDSHWTVTITSPDGTLSEVHGPILVPSGDPPDVYGPDEHWPLP